METELVELLNVALKPLGFECLTVYLGRARNRAKMLSVTFYDQHQLLMNRDYLIPEYQPLTSEPIIQLVTEKILRC